MSYRICFYCKQPIEDTSEGYCPSCGALLYQTRYEMEKERRAILYHVARRAIFEEDWELAISNLITLLRDDPDQPQIRAMLNEVRREYKYARLYERAQYFRDEGHWDKALKCLQKISEFNPDYRDVEELMQTIQREKQDDKRGRSKKPRTSDKIVKALLILLLIIFILIYIVEILLLVLMKGGILK